MTQQQAYQWLIDHEILIKNVTKFTREKQLEFFAVYNALNSVKKTQTSCGRCIHNMRVNLQSHLKTAQTMEVYHVYRTAKGNLSFKKHEEPVFTIRSNSKLGADEALAQLKAFEKREAKKVEDNGTI